MPNYTSTAIIDDPFPENKSIAKTNKDENKKQEEIENLYNQYKDYVYISQRNVVDILMQYGNITNREITNLYDLSQKDKISKFTQKECLTYLKLNLVSYESQNKHVDDEDYLTYLQQHCVNSYTKQAQRRKRDIYDWYLIDESIGQFLIENNEVVIRSGYGYWWGMSNRYSYAQSRLLSIATDIVNKKYENKKEEVKKTSSTAIGKKIIGFYENPNTLESYEILENGTTVRNIVNNVRNVRYV